ncbi:MAG: 4Fe-4S binding protein [Puniceicoccales bacterium]|jgi:ferredoxin|nr:4Fe-4S binding protein [Puniceicoccales bacterium]
MRYLRIIRICAALPVLLATIVAFLDYRDKVPVALKHAVTAVQFGPSAVALGTGAAVSFVCILVLAITALAGRVYCSTLCPLGLFQDVVSRMAALVRKISGKKKIRLPFRPAPQVLRQSILAATLLGVAVGWAGVVFTWLDPYSQFGRIAGALFRPPVLLAHNAVAAIAQWFGINGMARVPVPWAGLGAFLPPLLIFTAIVVMAAWRGRLYCSAVCPVGTLLGWVSKKALFRLAIDKSACVRCGDCQRTCKAQCIDLRNQEVDMSRCVGCFDCVSVCEEHGIGPSWLGRVKARGKLPEKRKAATDAASTQRQPALTRRAFVSGVGGVAVAGGLGVLGMHAGAKANAGRTASPPGSGGRGHFLDQCTACQLCVSACPSHVLEPSILQYGRGAGFMKPYMNFDSGFCNINCTVCGDVCPDGAIQRLSPKEKQVACIGVAKVTIELCIVRTQNTACGACAEHCPTAALQMKPGKGKFAEPVVNEAYCIGCGACQWICPALPVRAVLIHGREKHRTAALLVQEKAADPNAGKNAEGEFPF